MKQRQEPTHRPHDLGELDPAWEGFVLRDHIIYTPGGYPLRAGDLNCVQILHQQIANYKVMLQTPAQLLL